MMIPVRMPHGTAARVRFRRIGRGGGRPRAAASTGSFATGVRRAGSDRARHDGGRPQPGEQRIGGRPLVFGVRGGAVEATRACACAFHRRQSWQPSEMAVEPHGR